MATKVQHHSTKTRSQPKARPAVKDEAYTYVDDDGNEGDAEVINTKAPGGKRVVGIGNIRVVIVKDGEAGGVLKAWRLTTSRRETLSRRRNATSRMV